MCEFGLLDGLQGGIGQMHSLSVFTSCNSSMERPCSGACDAQESQGLRSAWVACGLSYWKPLVGHCGCLNQQSCSSVLSFGKLNCPKPLMPAANVEGN